MAESGEYSRCASPTGSHFSGDSTKAGRNRLRRIQMSTMLSNRRVPKYQYKEIEKDYTRVLMIHPRREGDGRIDVSINEVSFQQLGTGVRYEALSYHWDHGCIAGSSKPIYIHEDQDWLLVQQAAGQSEHSDMRPNRSALSEIGSGCIKTSKLFVKPNLYDALRNIRRDSEPVWLWVDALCINQDDLEEKDNQIARMNEIYSKAESVMIWLGDGDEKTKRAMAFIREIIDLRRLKNLVSDDSRINDWCDLIHLMRRSWFSRRWVIQEIAFSSNATVHCGPEWVGWNDFRDAISIFAHEFDRIRPLFKRSDAYDNDFYAIGDLDLLEAKVLVDMINNIFRKSKRGRGYQPIQGLEYLVSKLSSYESADPRDAIHALRNIAKETYGRGQVQPASVSNTTGQLLPPQVDYKKTLLQVYSDFVSWVAASTGSIDIICRHWASPEKRGNAGNGTYPSKSALPSWIQQIPPGPYGRRVNVSRERISGDSFVGLPGHKTYDACNGRLAVVRFSCDHVPSDKVLRQKPSTSSLELPKLHIDVSSNVLINRVRALPEEPDGICSLKRTRDEAATVSNDRDEPPEKHYKRETVVQWAERLPPIEIDVAQALDNGISSRTPRTSTTSSSEDWNQSDISYHSNASYNGWLSSAGSEESDRAWRSVTKQLLVQHRDASMYVDGMIIGTVSYRTDPIPDGVIPRKAIKKLTLASKKEDYDKLWRTLVAERDDHGRNPEPWYERACAYCVTHHDSNGNIKTKDLIASTRHPEHVQKFLRRVQGVIWNRCFMEIQHSTLPTTEPGRKHPMHGFGPSKTRAKDLVCILFGCSVPVILRRLHKAEIGEYYLFIGEAYVYGIMDGEAVSSLSEAEIRACTQTFRLL